MTWKAEVKAKRLDPNNLNILVDVEYTNEDGSDKRTQTIQANDLTDAEIAKRCQFFIEAAEARDVAFVAVSIGAVSLPRDAMSEQEIADAKAKDVANRALSEKLGEVARLNLFLPDDDAQVIAAKQEAQAIWAKANPD